MALYGPWQARCINETVEVDTMDRDQNQNYYGGRKTDENPGARNTTGSNDSSRDGSGGGISNRPDEEEVENQERLPPRGQEKARD